MSIITVINYKNKLFIIDNYKFIFINKKYLMFIKKIAILEKYRLYYIINYIFYKIIMLYF